jgi:hypothetical protein
MRKGRGGEMRRWDNAQWMTDTETGRWINQLVIWN